MCLEVALAYQKVVTQSARFHTGLTLTVDSFRGAHREQAAADQSLLSAHSSATGLGMVAPVSLDLVHPHTETPPLHLCCAAGSGTLHALSEANKAQDTWCATSASSSSSYTHHSPSCLTTHQLKRATVWGEGTFPKTASRHQCGTSRVEQIMNTLKETGDGQK